ncbi:MULTISPECIES: MerR family transcriptional regulator [unclassified Rhodococcus (in: high G+C Gram-positive bacteria)]|uniref:MerR family transcriptional regulator n=1 Tax=unclassified Rhodococcus (in: high G+C Gram-positive bacteria) TaxID=192944 RepID=UPI001639BBC8|nr:MULTISPECIES: MerR family transcriptional regulator [unclassified Rhodococcus (in: high G+C Gram-positive bacteria)]MBC2641975.1 MerR family transcriptional regulator [Rhodococcus sp. 3A]MBC2893284.1 MerR family transcriptional regulator [Rhodococcus sp. 4CII]
MPIRSPDDPAEQPRSDGPSRRPLYGISVAAELSGFAVGALRLYEQHGLVAPTRTDGGTRRYSDFDIARLRRVAELIGDGVNLVGIGQILALEQRTADLTHDNNQLTARNDQLTADNTRLSSEWRNASAIGQRRDREDQPGGDTRPRATGCT